MIGLFLHGGGRGDGNPLEYTVPWSPIIAARGPLPGAGWRSICRIVDAYRKHGRLDAFYDDPHGAMASTISDDGDPIAGLVIFLTLQLMRELEVVPRPAADPFIRYEAGEQVLLTCPHGETAEAYIRQASPSGKIIFLLFRGALDGHRGEIGLVWEERRGRFVSRDDVPFRVQRRASEEA